jgi:hypothetical protein
MNHDQRDQKDNMDPAPMIITDTAPPLRVTMASSTAALRDLRKLQRTTAGKAGAGVNSHLKALELVKGSGMDSRIGEKLAMMKRGTKSRKKAGSMRTHKFEWSSEAKRLHTQRVTLEREMDQDLSPELAEALAEAEAAEQQQQPPAQTVEAQSRKIWSDYEECAVLVKSLRSMGSSEMLRGRAADVLHALRRQLDTGLAELHGVEERLEVEVADTRGRQASATPTPGAPGQRLARSAPPGQLRPVQSIPEPEPEPELMRPGAGVARGSSASAQQRPEAVGTAVIAGAEGLESLRVHDQELSRTLHDLDTRFNNELQRLADDFAADLPEEIVQCEYGGWQPREHAVFNKLAREFTRNGQRETPAGRKRYMERLQLELPQMYPEELEAHDRWYDKRRYCGKKRSALVRQWKNARGGALTEAQYALETAAEEAVAALEVALDRRAVEAKKAALHRRLKVAEAVKGHRDEVKAKLEAEAEAVEEAERQKAMAQRRTMMDEGKRRVEQWRAARAAEAAAALKAEEEAAEMELEAYRAMLEVGAKRVAYRQDVEEQKREAADMARWEAEADAAARQEVLDSLAATVAPEVAYDPARALAHTEVTKPMSKAERQAERALASQTGSYRVAGGYTSKQVMSDKRYRTIESLRAAGLHEHPHARAAIASMPPARVITQHLTTNQLASMKS